MNLRHFSDLPVLSVYSVEQRPFNPTHYYEKPRGLWVSDESVENSWRERTTSEAPNLLGALEHFVQLHERANIKHVDSVDALDEFAQRYGEIDPTSRYYSGDYAINWALVASQFDGIIITPYLWPRRLHEGSSWYYGWDCASGCIWNANAVAKIEPLASPIEAANLLERKYA